MATDKSEAASEFSIVDGNWQALKAALLDVDYDGASNPAAWVPPSSFDADLALLFSDGIGNWGSGRTNRAPLPLYTVNAAAAANANLLRELAESSASGGQYLDLNQLETTQALAELQQVRPRFHSADVNGINDLTAPSVYPQQGRLRLAGRLNLRAGQAEATLNYSLLLADGKFEQHQLQIKPAPTSVELISDVAAKRWAGYRIAQLEAERHLHSAEIERLGSRFGLVSSQTSLLVLESLADYLRYQITPPAGPLRNEYLARRESTETDSPAKRSRHLDDLARRFSEVKTWWERDFPKDTPPQLNAKPEPVVVGAAARETAVRESRSGETRRSAMQPMMLMAAPSPQLAGAAAPTTANKESPGSAPASIQLQKWQPDAAYAKRLRIASNTDRYAIYLDERSGHLTSTAFFLDAADVFFEKSQAELALRVLSNLAEMDLESRHILRIVAYRLLQAGQTSLALPLLQRVRELAPEEPQSWRDLGLALAADGQGQAALDKLWETAARPWDGRFSDIDLTALAELNALIARTPGLDTSRIDPRLLHNLPLDLRAVLAWDADNTDIDLWVIDPNGEKTYYGQPLSYQGGKLSRDFTAGYGPETYSLKTAKPGRYEIRAQFYGHRQQVLSPYTTLMLRLSTGFGKATQKDENVTLRLSGQKEEVLVGSFEVGGQ
jgi:tetratricopeptide (TPR) repeat protein